MGCASYQNNLHQRSMTSPM